LILDRIERIPEIQK